MNRSALSALKTLSKRHHLWLQRDVAYDDLVATTSVFRQAGSRDEALVSGLVEDMDIVLAQRRFKVRGSADTNPEPLLLTICSTPIDPSEEQFLFVHRTMPTAFSLKIRHLRGSWQHTHTVNGYLLAPPHIPIPTNELQMSLEAYPATIELTGGFLTAAVAPALIDEEPLEELLRHLRRLRISIQ